MGNNKIRVGLIGARADGTGWGSMAHVPALRNLPDFELAAVCTTSIVSARASAERHGARLAFADPREMAAHPEIDLVAVSVRTPLHRVLIEAALAARKPVYCEWPFCRTIEDAEAMRDEAAALGVASMVGIQSVGDPAMTWLRDAIAEGMIGQVLSAAALVSTTNWGGRIAALSTYLLENANGATALSIPGGHTLSALRHMLGDVADVTATIRNLRPGAIVAETGATIAKTTPDQIALTATLASGAVVSLHVRGGMTAGGTRIEINGSIGDILIEAPGVPGIQFGAEIVSHRRAGGAWERISPPASYRTVPAAVPVGPAVNVAQMYAAFGAALRLGAKPEPDFAAGVIHKRLVAAISRAAETGQRQLVQSA